MQRLLAGWESNPAENTFLIGSAELFVPELEDLGLSNIPRNVVIHKSLLDTDLRNPDSIMSQITITRGTTNNDNRITLANWKHSYESMNIVGTAKVIWPVLAVPHIGGGQRAIRDRYSPTSTTLLIEPVFGHIGKAKDGTKVAVGLGFSLMSPPNFEVRIIGLESRLDVIGAN
jgi:hypothetical protein